MLTKKANAALMLLGAVSVFIVAAVIWSVGSDVVGKQRESFASCVNGTQSTESYGVNNERFSTYNSTTRLCVNASGGNAVGNAPNDVAYKSMANVSQGMLEGGSRLPIIGTVAALAVVLAFIGTFAALKQ